MSLSAEQRRIVARLRRRTGATQAPRGRWLILAPHPDDETLGVGQLICALAEAGRRPQVVYLTDGDASHPASPSWPAAKLAARRRREARAALRDLMGAAPPPIFLGWGDARPWRPGEPAFDRSAERLARWMRRGRLTSIAATWPHEPHCDHAAAGALAAAAARRLRGRAELYWYIVWGWGRPEAVRLAKTGAMVLAARPRHRRARRRALARHRSQLGAMVTDSPEAFRLPPAMATATPGVQVLFGPTRP